ncbi:Thioredoxin X, chloroplastic [Porphyridium purpureum]|uniref:Thioredoxin X, chloroplastic n=1 Tax=Porphyridium purpureum TaxID=35688 RepID=A0A5J4Z7X6_PORPP|nr:Thioredoxin X, chloroplastic [Porphyridium purpureum]|eukprot:POR9055..scf295_1
MATTCGFVSGSGAGNAAALARPGSRKSVCDVAPRRIVGLAAQRSTIRRVAPLRMVSKVGTVEGDAFDEEVLKSSTPVLVDFYADWCGPCKLMAPLMDWAASNYGDKLKVVKVDTEKNQNFVRDYKIHGLPTLAVFVNGENVAQVEGAMSKAAITELLESNVPAIKS